MPYNPSLIMLTSSEFAGQGGNDKKMGDQGDKGGGGGSLSRRRRWHDMLVRNGWAAQSCHGGASRSYEAKIGKSWWLFFAWGAQAGQDDIVTATGRSESHMLFIAEERNRLTARIGADCVVPLNMTTTCTVRFRPLTVRTHWISPSSSFYVSGE